MARPIAAGISLLRRDPADRHYGFFRFGCAHENRRQFEIVKRAASGTTGLRCDICQQDAEAEEAHTRGWALISGDPDGDPNYRVYQHGGGCGHCQRIARANLQSGRFSCAGCDDGWAASPSFLYLMQFTLASSRIVVKLGYSRDPQSRLTHQLRKDRNMPCRIVRVVPVISGNAAVRTEKRMHADLLKAHPQARVDTKIYCDQIKVRSEIYDALTAKAIHAMLDDVEAGRRPST